jgi:voltage-gated potassium channel
MRHRGVAASPAPEWRQRAFDRFSEATTLPMLILTVVMVPILIVPLARHDLSSSTRNLFETIDYFIWGVFLVEYLIRVTLAPRRLHFVTHNVADLVVVAVPMLRPLRIVRSARILRVLRLGRLTAVAGGGATKSKRSVASRATNYVLIVTGSLVVISSVVVLDLERSATGSSIRSFGDALWWALSTITTVGYGDHVPVTAGGKAVAAILMVSGIGLVGVITAAIAAFFVGHDRSGADRMPDDLAARLAAIEQLLTALAASTDRTIDVSAISVSLDQVEAPGGRPSRVAQ